MTVEPEGDVLPRVGRPHSSLSVTRTAPDRLSVSVPALALWLALQLGCLALAFLHVPLAATYPPGERLAAEMLLAAQIVSAALLAPVLVRTPATALVAAAAVWPALLLVGAVVALPAVATAAAGGVVTAWIAMLWAWITAFRSASARGVITAAASALSGGGAVLAYLVAEFGTHRAEGESTGTEWPGWTPVLLAWRIAGGDQSAWRDATYLAVLIVSGLFLASLRRRHVRPTATWDVKRA